MDCVISAERFSVNSVRIGGITLESIIGDLNSRQSSASIFGEEMRIRMPNNFWMGGDARKFIPEIYFCLDGPDGEVFRFRAIARARTHARLKFKFIRPTHLWTRDRGATRVPRRWFRFSEMRCAHRQNNFDGLRARNWPAGFMRFCYGWIKVARVRIARSFAGVADAHRVSGRCWTPRYIPAAWSNLA